MTTSTKIIALISATLGLTLASTSQAQATSLNATATLTADNHYGLFSGNNDGSVLNFVGRNEFGSGGNPGSFNWSLAETWNFSLDSSDHLYVVVWDDAAVAESWIGQFEFSTGETLLSKAASWEYMITTTPNPGNYGNVPSTSELTNQIQTGTWLASKTAGSNQGGSIWGQIPGITPDADFLNTTTPSSSKYTIFRTILPVSTVPEPTTVFGLVGLGVFGAVSTLKNKKKFKTA